MSGGWIGVDLDCTLAYYEKGQGVKSVGPVIEPMKRRVLDWLSQGKTLKIFTARVSIPADADQQRQLITEWLLSNGLPALEITCIKDTKMVQFWDDRAVQVIPNTGEPVK